MKRTLLCISMLVALQARAEWTRVGAGVDYQHIRRGALDAHVTRVDLTEADIRIRATDEHERGLTVSEFARKSDAIVAINGDYFNEQLQPIGVSIGACDVWWEGVKVTRNQGLVAFGNGRADIQANTQNTAEWMRGAVSGWPMLIRDCEVIADLPGSDHFTRAPHPRTAVGLSRDGKTAYFVVTDGRREGVPGLTLPELATFMREELEVCRAMNLDGGGSSAIWVRDAIVNVPSDGKERKVANHLAVVASDAPDECKHQRMAKE
ncbi:MAG TPA: phosphodiester glycosidase family protein [Thermoanaerobaculia bacterium]|nr:phosphodiester glycosidase family protein [Thermoanaerobaculia bacterium]